MIRGITFSEQAFYSADFAHYQNFFMNRQSGITKGCAVSQNGEQVTIDTGYFIAHGRMLNVEEPEIITEEAGFADGYNRIVYEIDLSKENSVSKFQQGGIKVLNTEALIQEDLDNGGKVYQMPFCHFQWNGIAISDFVIEAPTLVLENIFANVSANFDSVNETFNTWLTEQQEAAQEWTEEQKTASKAEMDKDVTAVDTYATNSKTSMNADVKTVNDYVTTSKGKMDTAVSGVNSYAATSKAAMDTDVNTIDSYVNTCKTSMNADVSSVNSHAETAKETIDGVVSDLADTTIGANAIAYDNTTSKLTAQTTQAAIDELATEKVDKVTGKGLSTNDYTTAEKNKLAGIATGATATKVKGNAESSYRTDEVNLTPENLGAAASEHKHDAADIISGTVAITNGGTGKTTATAGLAALGGTSIDLLWTNSSLSSSFVAQPVDVSLSEYSFVMILFVRSASNQLVNSCIVTVGNNVMLEGQANINTTDSYARLYERQAEVSSSKVTFNNCYGKQLNKTDSLGTVNTMLIPYQIYGFNIN